MRLARKGATKPRLLVFLDNGVLSLPCCFSTRWAFRSSLGKYRLRRGGNAPRGRRTRPPNKRFWIREKMLTNAPTAQFGHVPIGVLHNISPPLRPNLLRGPYAAYRELETTCYQKKNGGALSAADRYLMVEPDKRAKYLPAPSQRESRLASTLCDNVSSRRLSRVEAIEGHHLGPCSNEVVHKLLLTVFCGINLCQRT